MDNVFNVKVLIETRELVTEIHILLKEQLVFVESLRHGLRD